MSAGLSPQATQPMSLAQANRQFRDQDGRSLAELSANQDCLVVFLRHSGCTFCRQALDDLAKQRRALQSTGVLPVLVHLGDEQGGKDFFARYALDDLPRISDPQRCLYQAYGLQRGGLKQLLGPAVWWRGFKAAILAGHAFGRFGGDGLQMPGAFLVRAGEIIRQYRHRTAADRPDYCQLAAGPQRAGVGGDAPAQR